MYTCIVGNIRTYIHACILTDSQTASQPDRQTDIRCFLCEPCGCIPHFANYIFFIKQKRCLRIKNIKVDHVFEAFFWFFSVHNEYEISFSWRRSCDIENRHDRKLRHERVNSLHCLCNLKVSNLSLIIYRS